VTNGDGSSRNGHVNGGDPSSSGHVSGHNGNGSGHVLPADLIGEAGKAVARRRRPGLLFGRGKR
jgi:hypothetical protein